MYCIKHFTTQSVTTSIFLFFKTCPTLLNGGKNEWGRNLLNGDRAPLSGACCVGPVLRPPIVQFLFYSRISSQMFNVRTQLRKADTFTDFAWLRSATNRNHTRPGAHKHQAPVTPRTPGLSNRDVCSHHTEYNTPPTELRDRQNMMMNIWWLTISMHSCAECSEYVPPEITSLNKCVPWDVTSSFFHMEDGS